MPDPWTAREAVVSRIAALLAAQREYREARDGLTDARKSLQAELAVLAQQPDEYGISTSSPEAVVQCGAEWYRLHWQHDNETGEFVPRLQSVPAVKVPNAG